MPRLGHLVQDAVSVEDRRGHERLGLAAGEAEHDALIAGTFFLLLVGIGIDTERDVGGLLMQVILELGVLPMKALLLVADLAHGAARRRLDQLGRHGLGPAHLSRHDDAIGGHQRLDRHPRQGVGGEIEIDHRVRDSVAHFVGMALGDQLAGEEVVRARHGALPVQRRMAGRPGTRPVLTTIGPEVKPALNRFSI